jgi:ribosomal protein L19
MTHYKTLADFRAANKAAGMFFFSRDTVRFFKSRFESGLYNSRFNVFQYFLTSESNFDGTSRRFTVRRIQEDCGVETVLWQFTADKETARNKIRQIARLGQTRQDFEQ